MTDLFPLHIFPESALASSVVTTVLIGVFFVAFFNLRLGWVLSGLVVPGYMVPLLLVKPLAAMVVFGEGILTYALVWFYSEVLAARLGWNTLFGRDRFLALVLTGVAVRVALDGWLLPIVGEWYNLTFNQAFDYRNNLHSFGLIIVSLIANNFWKTGLLRGVVPMTVTVGLTYLVVRYGLMELTNFNINSLAYVYEDVAASILASPKAYIILITTAFIASRMNLLYGWDFSGILIPSLLALQWYQPGKILASFVEAGIILLLAHGALRLPVFRGTTMEGARKLLLFFCISYLYKFVLAYVVLWLMPEQKISDLYGFGYLLPTLLALKMHDKGIFARMTRATLQTSLVSVLAATVVGFAIQFLPNPLAPDVPTETLLVRPPPVEDVVMFDVVRAEKRYLYRTRLQNSMTPPLGADLEYFRVGLEALQRYRSRGEDVDLDEARAWLARVNYELRILEGRYAVLTEYAPRNHWGVYVVDLESESNLTIEVPAPLSEVRAGDAGLWLFRSMKAGALAISGAARRANQDGSSDAVLNPRTLFQVFHQTLARHDVLQVRGYSSELIRAVGGRGTASAGRAFEQPDSRMWVKHSLPRGLDLSLLKQLAGGFELSWSEPPLPSIQRETTRERYAELVLNQAAMRRILARVVGAESGVRLEAVDRSIEGYLQDWLLADKSRIAPAGSNAYVVPALEDLLYFDSEIFVPLLRLGREEYRAGEWTPAGLEGLGIIQDAAAAIDYEVLRYRHRRSGADYLILAEREDAEPRRYWGTYVLRLGEAEAIAVQSPRPVFEVNSFEFAASQFEALGARALLVGGAHPDANLDGSADIVRAQFRENIFNVANQALLREWGDRPAMVLQTRAIGVRPDTPAPPTDIVLADAAGALDPSQLPRLGLVLWESLQGAGLSVALADGSAATAGYEASNAPQAKYLEATRNKAFFLAWVSPVARASYRQQTEAHVQLAQFQALGIGSREADLAQELSDGVWRAEGLGAEERGLLARYLASRDIVLISGLRDRRREWRFERVLDLDSRQGFLVLRDANSHLLAVLNLNAREPGSEQRLAPRNAAPAIARFIASRSAWLLPEGH